MDKMLNKIEKLTTKVNNYAKEYPDDGRLEAQVEILQHVNGIILAEQNNPSNINDLIQKVVNAEMKGLIEKINKESNGCKICNDTSNDRYYRNQGYKYCPHCGTSLDYLNNTINQKESIPFYVTDEEFVNYNQEV